MVAPKSKIRGILSSTFEFLKKMKVIEGWNATPGLQYFGFQNTSGGLAPIRVGEPDPSVPGGIKLLYASTRKYVDDSIAAIPPGSGTEQSRLLFAVPIPEWVGVRAIITGFSDNGDGTVKASCSSDHGLSDGDTVTISATANYNGEYVITRDGGDVFSFTAAFVATETGSFQRKYPSGSRVWTVLGFFMANTATYQDPAAALGEWDSITGYVKNERQIGPALASGDIVSRIGITVYMATNADVGTPAASVIMKSKKEAIASFADAGGGLVKATTTDNHHLTDGQLAEISGTANYNGQYTISVVSDTEFTFTAAFVATETGDVQGITELVPAVDIDLTDAGSQYNYMELVVGQSFNEDATLFLVYEQGNISGVPANQGMVVVMGWISKPAMYGDVPG